MSALTPTRPQTDYRPLLHCLGFKPIAGSGSLIGTCDMHVSRWRAKLYGCGVFLNDGRLSVALPVRALIGSDRRVREDASGKTIHEPVLVFDDPATSRAFSDAVVEALRLYRPDLFPGESR